MVSMKNTDIAAIGRHLILIDIENLTASPAPAAWEVDVAIARLRAHIPGYDDDQRIVACSHHAARVVALAFPGARQIWRSGRDGADLALLDVLENERVENRYGRVTLCTGDGIFTEALARLGRHDVDVTVLALTGHLAARLELAARNVVLLPAPAAATATALGGA